MSTASEKFEEAKTALMFSQPFYGTLLLKLEHVEDATINPQTMCVSRTTIRYHPGFVDSLTLDETVFVLAHEVMHLAWMHLPRIFHYLSTGNGPDGQPLDVQLFNKALDYPINALLVEQKIGAPIPAEKFPMCLDASRFPSTMVPEDVYIELKKDQKKNGGGKSGGQQPMDGHDGTEVGDGAADPITPADVIQAAQQHKAIKGDLPGGMERMLGELKKPTESPWAQLRSFITRNLPGADATSWRRLQRRPIVRGIGMPGPVQKGAGLIGVVVDTSGSIGQEMLDLFAGHLAAIIADARPLAVNIYWTDTRVHRVDTVVNGSQLRQVMAKKVPGGGGTDMPNGVKACEQDKCDAIVVLTDGYTDFCSSNRPLIWAITTHGLKASGNGKSIHIH